MNLSIQKPLVCLFDWDGTLADTEKAVTKGLEAVLEHFGQASWQEMKKKRDISKSWKENFPNFFGPELADEAYIWYVNYYEKYCLEEVKPMPGAHAFLTALSDSGILKGIVSNKEKSLLIKEVSRNFPDISFFRLLGNGEAERNKPAPDPVYKILEGTSISPSIKDVWFIGDSGQDLSCAFTSGCQPILMKPKENFASFPTQVLQKGIYFSSFNELSDFFHKY